MAPTSSNTVAKCVYGISDSLASNIFAQAGKCRVECIYFPCDTAPELKTLAPSGYVDVYPRRVDLANVEKLKKFADTLTVMSFKKLKEAILKKKKMSEKILFITGRLAERQLKRILDSMKPEFSYQINQVGVNVAALMSESILMRRLSENQNFDRIIVPGKFRGDLKRLSNYFKIPVQRGPDDISDLPDYFGIQKPDNQLKDYDCEIFAEIVDAAILPTEEIKKIAESYKKDGANVIDLGCMPDTDFNHLEESIRAVKSIGCKVSVDSADSNELIRGSKAGADYILSVNEKNLNIMDKVNSTPILIPNTPGNLSSLEKVVKLMIDKKRNFYADPILDPIHYGFADSIERFVKIRKKFPNIKLFMGTGNLTELTDCDSSGANAIMMGLVSELSINAVLVVQVSEHCKNSIKETDMARKIMHFSKKIKDFHLELVMN